MEVVGQLFVKAMYDFAFAAMSWDLKILLFGGGVCSGSVDICREFWRDDAQRRRTRI